MWWAEPAAEGRRALAHLDAAERTRHHTYRCPADAARFATGRAVAKLALGKLLGRAPCEVRLDASCPHCGAEHGKPRMPGSGLELSIAHAGDRVAVAISEGAPVGVDVEWIARHDGRGDLPLEALTSGERRILAALPAASRTVGFLHYWTRKEAVLKATGHGLAIDLRNVGVSAPAEPPRLERWTAAAALPAPAHLRALSPGPGYLACVAVLSERPPEVVERRACVVAPEPAHRTPHPRRIPRSRREEAG